MGDVGCHRFSGICISVHDPRVAKKSQLVRGVSPGRVVGDPNYFTISAVLTLPLRFI